MLKLLKNNKGMAAWFMPAAVIGSSLIGAVSSAFGQSKANKQQAEEAQKTRDFQQDASDTAHQREVKDLRAAGLNPILSAKYGGASTPSGAMADVQNVFGKTGDIISNGISTAMQVAQTKENIKLTEAQKLKTLEEARDLKRENDILDGIKPGFPSKKDSSWYRDLKSGGRVGDEVFHKLLYKWRMDAGTASARELREDRRDYYTGRSSLFRQNRRQPKTFVNQW